MARDHEALMAELAALTEGLRTYRDTLAQKPLPHSYEETSYRAPDREDDIGWVPKRAARPRPLVRPVGVGATHALTDRDADSVASGEVLALAQPDWLFHVLTVSGPVDGLDRFRRAATGPGIIPWSDDRLIGEDLVDRLVREQPGPGAGTEAQGLIDRVLGLCRPSSRVVPLDLHALVPIPDDILALGPTDPRARSWLWTHWGTTQPLRQVIPVVDRPGAVPDVWSVSFWSADWTPWRALGKIRRGWPMLSLAVRPVYDP